MGEIPSTGGAFLVILSRKKRIFLIKLSLQRSRFKLADACLIVALARCTISLCH